MPSALEMTGDIVAAATALAGLMLVFIGAVSTSFESYQRPEQAAVRARFQTRVWIAFAGFALALLAAIIALFGKWLAIQCLAFLAFALLLIAFVFTLFGALSAVRAVK